MEILIEIAKGIILVVGGYYSIMFLLLAMKIHNMSKDDYKRLQKASRTKEGWKWFWDTYER